MVANGFRSVLASGNQGDDADRNTPGQLQSQQGERHQNRVSDAGVSASYHHYVPI
jgi:hypothetical protein